MKVQTINFQRLISTGSFENIRIGADASVDADESPTEAFTELVKQVNTFYDSMSVEDMRGTTERIIEKVEPKTQTQMLVDAVKSCTVWDKLKGGLDSFTTMVKNNPEAQAAYDEMKLKLKP